LYTKPAAEIIAARHGDGVSKKEKALMELEKRKIGEAAAAVGVVLGLIALWAGVLDGVTGTYSKDGTFTTAMIILLGLAACCLAASLLGSANLDLVAATAGGMAFGLFLYVPAIVAFSNLDRLGSGAWLGICAGLIPLGAGFAHFAARGRSAAKAPVANPATAVVAIGLVLIVVGIWMRIEDKWSVSYWNASSSGHALGLLLLLLAIVSALYFAGAVNSRSALLADLALIVSGITAGVAMSEGIHDAFGAFNVMGSGAWMELFGGLALLIGLIGTRMSKFPAMKKSSAS
jgi:hypothetical protein